MLLDTINPEESMTYQPMKEILGATDPVTDILSTSFDEIMILTNVSIIVQPIEYSMLSCHLSCRTCYSPGAGECSSCSDGFTKETSWLQGDDTKGSCVKVPFLCDGRLITNCATCVEDEKSCQMCEPGYGVVDKSSSEGEQDCQKCCSDKVDNVSHKCQDKSSSIMSICLLSLILGIVSLLF